MTADPKSLVDSTLAVRATRGVVCRARRWGSSQAVDCRNRGVSDPPLVPWFLVPRLCAGGRSRPGSRCRLSGQS
jgi:hypothetical protein